MSAHHNEQRLKQQKNTGLKLVSCSLKPDFLNVWHEITGSDERRLLPTLGIRLYVKNISSSCIENPAG